MSQVIANRKTIDGQEVVILIETASATTLPEDPIWRSPDQETAPVLEKGGSKPVELARDLYDDAMTLATNIAIRTMAWQEQMKAQAKQTKPDELSLTFGIKMDAQWGAILTKAGAEAQLQVTMKWSFDSENETSS